MLSKHFWKLLGEKESLWAKTMWAKYWKYLDLAADIKVPMSVSPIFKSLYKTKEIVKLEYMKRLGNGEFVNILEDYWLTINDIPTTLKSIIQPFNPTLSKVKDLLLPNHDWNPTCFNFPPTH